MPTTVRVVALAAMLALLSNLAVLAFIRWRIHDEARSALSQRVTEETRALSDVYGSGGRPALVRAIRDTLAGGDPLLRVALLGGDGMAIGNVPADALPALPDTPVAFAIVTLPRGGRTEQVGVAVRDLGGGLTLVSGRGFGERMELQHTLERSLVLAVLLSVGFGVICGVITARYVGRRVRAIAQVVDRVGEGDLARRAPIGGSGDAFDMLSARINNMLDRIGALMGELRLLTDSLAHDLRSPVGRLRARIERALTTPDEEVRDQMLNGVLAEADALMRILTTVLEIGRSEAQASRRQFAPIDPAALIAELAEMYEPLAEEKGLALEVDAVPPLAPLMGHRQLLAQAISNLVDNALVYAAGGGRIRLVARADEDALRLGVADAGPGIAARDREEARRRFGRLDTSRSAPGAGLGLALVDAVAHLHGGTLELADNAPGLRAELVLPLGRRG